jgi:hypothetical protein
MKNKLLIILIVCFSIVCLCIISSKNLRYRQITKIDITFTNSKNDNIVITDKKSIITMMKCIGSAKKTDGVLIFPKGISPSHILTIYYSNNQTEVINLILGKNKSIYFKGINSMNGYEISEKNTQKLRETITSYK